MSQKVDSQRRWGVEEEREDPAGYIEGGTQRESLDRAAFTTTEVFGGATFTIFTHLLGPTIGHSNVIHHLSPRVIPYNLHDLLLWWFVVHEFIFPVGWLHTDTQRPTGS
jgi:hypothetical protein